MAGFILLSTIFSSFNQAIAGRKWLFTTKLYPVSRQIQALGLFGFCDSSEKYSAPKLLRGPTSGRFYNESNKNYLHSLTPSL